MRIFRLSPIAVRAIQIALLVAFVLAWEFSVQTGRLDKFFYSQPSLVFGRLGDWFGACKFDLSAAKFDAHKFNAALAEFRLDDAYGGVYSFVLGGCRIGDHIATTLGEMLAGFVLGIVVGIMLGFALGRSANLGAVFEPLVVMLNSMPRVVLAPLFVLWFGLGPGSKVVYAFVLVVFPVFFATFTGVREVDQNYIDNVRILGARRGDLTRHVLIPSALTWIFSSLRISVGFALIGAVVGEYLAATKGVGYVIAFAEASFDTTGVFAGLILLMAIVVVLDAIIRRVEARFSVWKPQKSF